jgi:predicted metal-binding membrane protein
MANGWREMASEMLSGQVTQAAPGTKAPPALPMYDRLLVIVGIAGIVAVSWAYLVIEAGRMGGADMAAMVELRPRDATGLVLLFLMWAVMMVAMMLPSAMPMILLQAAVMRKIENGRLFSASLGAIVGGYVVVWTLFSIAATILQAYLEHLALLSPMMVSKSPQLGGLILVAAGVYQVTPMKDVCLKHCQTPIAYVAAHWRLGVGGAFRMGLHHGLFCVGCCWLLMALLFVGGVMNLLWIAVIAAFVLLEKIARLGNKRGRAISGLCLMTAGTWLLVF